MIYPWQYELLERKVEHNLWSKEQTCFWGNGRERKHWLEVVYNKCPQVVLWVFTYLCTTIWFIFLPSVLQTRLHASCTLALQSRRCSSLWLTPSYGGPTIMDDLKVKLKACRGWGEAPLIMHHLLQATTSRLWQNLGTKMRTVPKMFSFAGRTSFLFGPYAKTPCQKFSEDKEVYQRRLAAVGPGG